jgi:hypothetical protein
MGQSAAPQFRTRLIRRIRNVYPAWKYDLIEEEGGPSFELLDENGDPKGNRVRFHGYHDPDLSKNALVRFTGIWAGQQSQQ